MLQDFLNIRLQSSDLSEQFRMHSCLHLLYIEQAKSSQSHVAEQLSMISEQNDLLRQIKQKVGSRRSLKQSDTLASEQETIDACGSEAQSVDNSSRTQLFDSSLQCSTETASDSPQRRVASSPANPLEVALAEIESRCQRSTCEVISQLLKEAAEKSALAKTLESSLSRLETENLILKERLEHQHKYIASLEERLKSLESDLSLRARTLNDKDQRLVKLQTSLVVREEMVARDSRKLKAKAQQLRDKESQLACEREQLDSTWEQVLFTLEPKDDAFRTQVYSRCKDSLLKQRKMLAEEQKALETQHENIQKMVAQFKEHGAL